jgi:hypothetical protein
VAKAGGVGIAIASAFPHKAFPIQFLRSNDFILRNQPADSFMAMKTIIQKPIKSASCF